jgi:hypothetical protein
MQPFDLATFLVTVVAMAAALSPFVVGFTELVKRTVKGAAKGATIPAELVPALAALIGLGLAMLLLYGQPGIDWRTIALGGPLSGLMATGLFDRGQAADKADAVAERADALAGIIRFGGSPGRKGGEVPV